MTTSFPLAAFLLLSVALADASLIRAERQTGTCRSHRCNNGQCIETFSVCDGIIDCDDGSDETKELCHKDWSCPNGGFKCAYGACVDRNAICNGKSECADDSDELLPQCRPLTKITASKCKDRYQACNSGECIEYSSFCDGHIDCVDQSDESIALCINLKCEPGFQCAYGACIDELLKCNGVNDCHDKSDEDPLLCKGIRPPPAPTRRPTTKSTNATRPKGACTLPDHPAYGKYTVSLSDGSKTGLNPDLLNAYPGTEVPLDAQVFLNYSCNPGYILDKAVPINYCSQGNWAFTFECHRLCPSLFSTSVDLKCTYQEEVVKCNEPMKPKTKVVPKCKKGFELESINEGFSATYCLQKGVWERDLFSCEIVCGVLERPAIPTTRNPYVPWHVGIYQKLNGTYTRICGGTIVNQFSVLTAAHCVHDVNGTALPHSSFKVVAGSHLNEWDNHSPFKFRTNVEQIIKPETFRGQRTKYAGDVSLLIISGVFPLSPIIMPVCIDWDMTTDSHLGTKGVVAGWWLNANKVEQKELSHLRMSYMKSALCHNAVPNIYKQYIIHEKFCGVIEENKAHGGVANNNLGSGFVIERKGLHFITGVASLKSPTDKLAIFVDLAIHKQWMKKVFNAYEKQLSSHN